MTGKRFIYCEEENGEFPFPYIKCDDGKNVISLYECVDLLNSLNDENEQLKHKLQQQEMEYATDLHRLAEENEQLRTKNNAYIQDIEVFKEENTHLKLENEQLKSDLQYWAKTAEARLKKIEQLKTTIQQLRTDNTKQKKLLNTTMKQNKHTTTTIKTMMDTERTELGKSVLKQLWSAIQ
jgi:chromosome segregation ATPase